MQRKGKQKVHAQRICASAFKMDPSRGLGASSHSLHLLANLVSTGPRPRDLRLDGSLSNESFVRACGRCRTNEPSRLHSMYGIYAYIDPPNHPNVGIYSIHGVYGIPSSQVKRVPVDTTRRHDCDLQNGQWWVVPEGSGRFEGSPDWQSQTGRVWDLESRDVVKMQVGKKYERRTTDRHAQLRGQGFCTSEGCGERMESWLKNKVQQPPFMRRSYRGTMGHPVFQAIRLAFSRSSFHS